MGGIGSGRHWQQGSKPTTDHYREIDIRKWKREGLLDSPGWYSCRWLRRGKETASISVSAGPDRVVLSYRQRLRNGDWEPMSYPVYLDWTDCHLGGQRPWFLCPGAGCGKRVAILYGGSVYACRDCHGIAYSSQRETWDDRAIRRADRIRRKLGWQPGIANGLGPKPKGMHYRTFERLGLQHARLVLRACDGFRERFRISDRAFFGNG